MKRSAEIISGIAVQVFMASVVVWLFCFSKVNHPFTVMEIRYPLLCGGLILAYGIDYILIQKGIRLSFYAALQVAMIAGGVFLCLYSIHLEPAQASTVVILCVLYAVSFLSGAFIAHEHVAESGTLIRFDLSAFMIIVLLILEKWQEFPAKSPALIMCLASLGVSLAAIIASRVGRYGLLSDHVQGSSHAGRVFLALSLVVIAGLTALIYFLTSGTMEGAAAGIVQGLKAAGQAVLAAVRYLYQLLERFFQWLAGLFAVEEVPVEMDMQGMPGMESDTIVRGDVTVPVWFYIILGLLAAGLLFLFIYKLRKYRIRKHGGKRSTAAMKVVRRSHLKSSLRQLFAGLRRRLRFRIDAFRWRNTVPGILLWCERHVSREQARWKQESAQAFLRRLADTKTSTEYRTALLSLADLAERSFYAGGPMIYAVEDTALFRTVKKAIRVRESVPGE